MNPEIEKLMVTLANIHTLVAVKNAGEGGKEEKQPLDPALEASLSEKLGILEQMIGK